MPEMNGSFAGKIRVQTAIGLTDRPNHEMNLAEVSGAQKASDERWNGAVVNYWGITDMLDGKGTQTGYFTNDHGQQGRDFGTFEGKATAVGGQLTVEGSWKFTGGTGEYRGLSGNGTFKTKMTSPTDADCSWKGTYELARAQAR